MIPLLMVAAESMPNMPDRPLDRPSMPGLA